MTHHHATTYDLTLLPPDDPAAAAWERYEDEYSVPAAELLTSLITETLPTGMLEREQVEAAVRQMLHDLPRETLLCWASAVDGDVVPGWATE